MESPVLREPRQLRELDLKHLEIGAERVTAKAGEGLTVELTLDPALQRIAHAELERTRATEAGVVLSDVKSGRILAYASIDRANPGADVNLRAEAPAASIFKLVTGAALVERAHLNAETRQCYHGGRSRILREELIENPRRDTQCATLGNALGRSLNVVFGRLSSKHLAVSDLRATASALGFGAEVPFVLANQPPLLAIPEEPLEFARTAAGFWNTSLSPLAAAVLAQTLANRGETIEPSIVRRVERGTERIWSEQDHIPSSRRVLAPETCQELARMMVETVRSGSARRAFHYRTGQSYLPGIDVAGKTGTLSRLAAGRAYSWFVGFAPAELPEVAIAVLAVSAPAARVKAAELAREMLRAHFAKQGAQGVTTPSL